MDQERRQYRRLAIRLPLEYYAVEDGHQRALRTVSTNISTGGLYFELELIEDAPVPRVNSLLNVALTVPPGDGHFPYESQVSSTAKIVRCEPLATPAPTQTDTPARLGVAACFCEPLKLAF
jgi:c-di-GMP-binding flagellar brake protein YcgR